MGQMDKQDGQDGQCGLLARPLKKQFEVKV